LLLEPQRTNLVTYSEQFNNAAWLNGQNSGAATITANQIISPDGYLDADKIAFPSVGAGGQYNLLFQPFTASATAYTASVYLRGENGGEVVWLSFTKDGVNYNRTQCTLTTAWQRFTLSATLTAGSDNFQIGVDTRDSSQSARPAQTIYAWGAQLEQGAYSTSLIPTLAASATRGADACSKTGISSLIGQTEGTLFVEFDFNGNYDSNGIVALDVLGAGSNEAFIYITGAGLLRLELYVSGAIQGSISTSIGAVGRKKIAFGYKQNDFVGYMNGVQIGTDTSGTVGAMDTIYVGTYQAPTYATGAVNQALLFKTRLTNSELAELTSL
jgi:microcompartment protein CcmK/EutM